MNQEVVEGPYRVQGLIARSRIDDNRQKEGLRGI